MKWNTKHARGLYLLTTELDSSDYDSTSYPQKYSKSSLLPSFLLPCIYYTKFSRAGPLKMGIWIQSSLRVSRWLFPAPSRYIRNVSKTSPTRLRINIFLRQLVHFTCPTITLPSLVPCVYKELWTVSDRNCQRNFNHWYPPLSQSLSLPSKARCCPPKN